MKSLLPLLFLFGIFNGSNATQLYSKAYGKKADPAIIFIHGGPGYNSYSFELSTAQKLADRGFYVIVFDQRGCGRSAKDTTAKYTREETITDLLSLYEKYEVSNASLIGHSWGGIPATWFSLAYPEKVNKLLFLDAPLYMQHTLRTILATCRKV